MQAKSKKKNGNNSFVHFYFVSCSCKWEVSGETEFLQTGRETFFL